MNPRTAMKEAIKSNLINLGMDGETAANVAEKMHDDTTFLEELEKFFQDHLDTFGENYGL